MKIQPPPLLDELLEHHKGSRTTVGILVTPPDVPGTRWYLARPLDYPGWSTRVRRVYHAWLVLCGRARAYQYREDRP